MNKQGFTLIELVIVISIMGVLMAIAIPATRGWRESIQHKEVARNVLSVLRHARSQAVADSRERSVTIDIGNQRYSTSYSLEGKSFPVTSPIEARDSDGVGVAWKTGGTFVVKFRPQGSCDTEIYVRVNGRDDLVVRIDSTATGLARL